MSVPEDRVISLPLGLPGFPEEREFVLVDHRPGSMFRWLQSLSTPGLAFVVVDPVSMRAQYPTELVRRSLEFLRLPEDEPLIVLAICTVPHAPEEPTVNLLAPIGIGLNSRVGAQVVLHEAGFGPRESFLSLEAA